MIIGNQETLALMSKKNKRKTVALFAYTDESGNTGQNLFDPAQPYFFTGTLLTRADVDVEGTDLHVKLLARLGVTELHGNQIGLGRINLIAAEILQFLQTYGAQFVFTQVEKRHHAAGRLCFAILDSDYNKAVSPAHDLHLIFHRKLALDIYSCLTYGDARAFWEAFESVDLPKFVKLLGDIRMRISDRISDPRSKTLLSEALSWAISNPGEILRAARTKTDSVNLLALGLLIRGIHATISKNSRVITFRHDEQNQFGKEIAAHFELRKNVKDDIGIDSLKYEMRQSERFLCPIEILPSHKSFGLQLVDVALYLASQAILGTFVSRQDECAVLCSYIVENGHIQDFTYEGLCNSFESQYEEYMGRDITPEQLERASQLRDRVEVARTTRMTSNES